jgi:hypothetical protein
MSLIGLGAFGYTFKEGIVTKHQSGGKDYENWKCNFSNISIYYWWDWFILWVCN